MYTRLGHTVHGARHAGGGVYGRMRDGAGRVTGIDPHPVPGWFHPRGDGPGAGQETLRVLGVDPQLDRVPYWPVGGPEIMRAQLHHLAHLAQRPNIDLQVLPLARGAHTGLDGTFTVLDFPLELPADPGTVYVQTQLKGVYYEEPAEIDEYRQTLTRLQADALTPAETHPHDHPNSSGTTPGSPSPELRR